MVSLQQSVFIFAALAALVSSAFAINCYQCESALDPKCADPYKPEDAHKFDCSTQLLPNLINKILPLKNATGCMKSVNEVLGSKHTVRSCYFGDVKLLTGCESSSDISAIKPISCEVCTGNLCNGSTVISTAPIALAITLIALVANKLF